LGAVNGNARNFSAPRGCGSRWNAESFFLIFNERWREVTLAEAVAQFQRKKLLAVSF
jgi:hypothetical protein